MTAAAIATTMTVNEKKQPTEKRKENTIYEKNTQNKLTIYCI